MKFQNRRTNNEKGDLNSKLWTSTIILGHMTGNRKNQRLSFFCRTLSSNIMWNCGTVGQIIKEEIEKAEILTDGHHGPFYKVIGDDIKKIIDKLRNRIIDVNNVPCFSFQYQHHRRLVPWRFLNVRTARRRVILFPHSGNRRLIVWSHTKKN